MGRSWCQLSGQQGALCKRRAIPQHAARLGIACVQAARAGRGAAHGQSGPAPDHAGRAAACGARDFAAELFTAGAGQTVPLVL